MKEQLLIPEKIKVGFQKREGTYTGKLAYVVYYDRKGVLRKEVSWEGWRDKKIDPVDFNNEPTEGFVLNKGVGGARASYGWNPRNEYIRVYDPRDFEFEISVANLLFILRECDCSRGKGLEGKFVYAWDKNNLVLLPVVSQEYKDSSQFTKLQGQGVKAKDLIPGASYLTKKQETMTYLGRFDYHYLSGREVSIAAVDKRHVFLKGKEFVLLNDLKSVATLQSDAVAVDYASRVDDYNKSIYGSKVVRLFLKEEKSKPTSSYYSDYWYYEESPGVFVQCQSHYKYGSGRYTDEVEYTNLSCKWEIRGGVLHQERCGGVMYPANSTRPVYHHYHHSGFTYASMIPWREPTAYRLYAELESGAKFKVEYNTFTKR